MADPKVNVDVKLNAGRNCPHMEIERVRAAQLKQLCPLCVFQDLLGSAVKAKVLGMAPDVPSPNDLGLPPPPPPVTRLQAESGQQITFFGFVGGSTLQQKLAEAKREGESEMWSTFMEALYPGRVDHTPPAKPNPAAADRLD